MWTQAHSATYRQSGQGLPSDLTTRSGSRVTSAGLKVDVRRLISSTFVFFLWGNTLSCFLARPCNSLSQQLRYCLFVATLNRAFRWWRHPASRRATESLPYIGGPTLSFVLLVEDELLKFGFIEGPKAADAGRARQFSARGHSLNCPDRQTED